MTAVITLSNLQAQTWDTANATSTSWALDGNWVGGSAPIAAGDVVVNADGTFAPSDNSAYTGISINSLTLEGATSLTLGSSLMVGAGGVHNNMLTNSLVVSDVELTADQTWGGTRTIFVAGGTGISGVGKMTFEGSAIRFDVNSNSWSTGLDARGTVQMNGSFPDSSTVTPWGTGTISLINERTDGSNVNSGISLASGAGNVSLATANTLANDIVLQEAGDSGSNFTISQSNNASSDAGLPPDHNYILSGVISGAVSTARTLTLSNGRSNSSATFTLSNANTHTATTTLSGSNEVTLAIGNVDALQNSTLNTGGSSAARAVTFTVAGSNTYNLGGLTGADDLDIGANSLSIGSNDLDGTFSGVLSGSGGIAKLGEGTLTLSGANTNSGTTTVSAGALIASTPASLSGYDSAGKVIFDGGTIGVSVGAGGWLDADLNDLLTNATKNSGSVGIDTSIGDFTQTSAYNFSPLGLSVTGANQLTLDQANTIASTSFTGDSLVVEAEGALGTGAVTGSTNAELTFNTPADATFNNDITLDVRDDSGIVNASPTSTITLGGAVEIDKNYAALVGTGVNNAGFIITGSLIGGPGSRMGIKDTNLTITSTGSVVYNSFARLTLAESGGDGGAVYLEDGASLGVNLQDSNNRVTTAGKTFIVGMNSAGSSTWSGADLVKRAGSAANDWEFRAVTDASALFSGVIKSSQAVGSTITKTGAGTVIFAGNNTYDGSTTISEGTLQIGNGGSTGKLATTSTIVNDGVLAFNTSTAIVQGVDFSGDPITGAGSLSILDGNVTLNAANTYGGGTAIDSATLTIGADGAEGSGAITGTNGAVLAFDTPSDTTFSKDVVLDVPGDSGLVNASSTSTVTLEGTVQLNAGFAAVVGTGVSNAGFVIADGGVLKAGVTQRLGLKDTNLTIQAGGAVDYAGSFQRLTLAENGGAGSAVYLENGADLDMVIYDTNNGNVTSDAMTFIVGMQSAGTATFSGLGGESVDLNHRNDAGSLANEWEFTAVAGATANFTGRIANDNPNSQATINKTGDGVVSFQANNTYAGATTVSAGTLELASGTQASPITVNNGAALGFVVGSTITSTAAVAFDPGSLVTVSGFPALGDYTLLTAGSPITGSPTLSAPVPGWSLVVAGNELQLIEDSGTTYEDWAATNAGGQTPEEDFDLDGVQNGVEFFLNSPAGFTANPGLVGGTVTWPNGGNIDSSEYGALGQFYVQTSSDLATWDDVDESDGNLTNTGASVTYTPTDSAPFFIRFVVNPTLTAPVE